MPQSHSIPEHGRHLDANAQATMLRVARLAIRSHWHPELLAELALTQEQLTTPLQPIPCFVPLHKAGELRGCIGCLEADKPLAEALVYFAQAAAFGDPRFAPLDENELESCHITISLLGPLSPLPATTRQQLLEALEPNRDGLWLQSPGHRATFLPAVWRELPDANQFLNQLLRKGGWPANGWPTSLQGFRYQTLEFGELEP